MSERDEAVVRQDAYMWSMVARMHAAVATIEGMKALNQHRADRGEAQGYDEESFNSVRGELENIANQLLTGV